MDCVSLSVAAAPGAGEAAVGTGMVVSRHNKHVDKRAHRGGGVFIVYVCVSTHNV